MQVYFNTCFLFSLFSFPIYSDAKYPQKKEKACSLYSCCWNTLYIPKTKRMYFVFFCKKSSAYPIYKIPSYDIIDEPEI